MCALCVCVSGFVLQVVPLVHFAIIHLASGRSVGPIHSLSACARAPHARTGRNAAHPPTCTLIETKFGCIPERRPRCRPSSRPRQGRCMAAAKSTARRQVRRRWCSRRRPWTRWWGPAWPTTAKTRVPCSTIPRSRTQTALQRSTKPASASASSPSTRACWKSPQRCAARVIHFHCRPVRAFCLDSKLRRVALYSRWVNCETTRHAATACASLVAIFGRG